MKKLGILGAMELELDILKENLKIESKAAISGFDYYQGTIYGQEVVLACCGVGKVNAAVCTQILIDHFEVTGIINTGIAGGLHNDVKICDVVISSDVTYHDVKKSQMRSCFPFVEHFPADKALIGLALKACGQYSRENWRYHHGRIVTGEYFVDNDAQKCGIIQEHSPHCVEMEGAAIGHAAYLNDVPFVIIRSISDNADDNARMNYPDFEKVAADQSSSIVLNMIKML